MNILLSIQIIETYLQKLFIIQRCNIDIDQIVAVGNYAGRKISGTMTFSIRNWIKKKSINVLFL